MKTGDFLSGVVIATCSFFNGFKIGKPWVVRRDFEIFESFERYEYIST